MAHSASPPMHNAALQQCGLPFSYVRLHILPSQLSEAITLLKRLHFVGVNLTIPHKAAVLPLLDEMHPHAQKLGVVNTIAFREGKAVGFNTDAPGLARAIQDDLGVRMGDCRTMILGAGGGAGRAAAMQCIWEGCQSLVLVNRTLSKAEELASELHRVVGQRTDHSQRTDIVCVKDDDPRMGDFLGELDLVIQCSSLGMAEGDPSPLCAGDLHRRLRVYDTIYSRKTQLVIDAEGAGIQWANGLSMLLHQGALAFEIWFSESAPVAMMKSALVEATRN